MEGVTAGYNGLIGVSRGYSRFQVSRRGTDGYKELQRVTGG